MIKEQISLIDEDYIVNLTNKGMYKRALKSMDKEDISLIRNWIFQIGDETVEFNDKLEDFKCTCPASSYCKHVVMAYMFMMNNLQSDMEKVALSLDDFAAIKDLTNKDLRKFVNKTMINNVLVDFKFDNMSYEIGSLLKVNFTNGKQVNFVYPFSIEEAFKNSGEKEVIMAIKYIQSLNGVDKLKVDFKITNRSVLEEVREYFENLILIGLYTINENEIDKLEYISIKLRFEKFKFLFRKTNYLRDRVKRYIKGDIDSGLETVKRQIIDILFDIYILLGNAGDHEKYSLIRKNKYKSEISEMNVYGLSYEIVKLNDGGKLINMIVIDMESGEIFEISNLRKNIMDKSISHLPLFFQNTLSGLSLIDKSFKIKNINLKEENKISNSTKLGLDLIESENFDLENYAVSITDGIESFIDGEQRLFILSDRIDSFNNLRFREEIQRFEISVGNLITHFKYEDKRDKEIIDRLNLLKKVDYMLIKLSKVDFHIDAKIITIWSGGEKVILRES
ncbi:MAG: hypothetical protein N4A76_08760 [Firmicutes bacterium]|jgi:hypothetical protein|nr:hypothetical protein [Bacillota bacterium]